MDSPILSPAQMREAEEAAFGRGVEVEALMDKAGAGVARTVSRFFPDPATCIVFAGKGHNGGDALVAAEHLKRAGWRIDIRLGFAEEDGSELTRKNLQALRDAPENLGPERLWPGPLFSMVCWGWEQAAFCDNRFATAQPKSIDCAGKKTRLCSLSIFPPVWTGIPPKPLRLRPGRLHGHDWFRQTRFDRRCRARHCRPP